MKFFRSLKDIPFIIVLQSLLVAFYADIKCINLILAYGYSSIGENDGYLTILYASAIFMMLICTMYGKNNILKRTSSTCVILILFLVVFYQLTLNFIGPPKTKFPMFLIMVVASILVPNMLKIDARIFIKAIMSFPAFAIFKLDEVFAFQVDWKNTISMDVSYAFLVPICATITYMCLYYREDKKWDKVLTSVLCAINMVYFTQLLQYGSRGPIFCVLLMIAFLYLIKYPKTLGVRKKRNLVMILVSGLIVLYFSLFSLLSTISFVSKLNGINLHFVDKIIELSSEGDITNGRDMINNITISGIIDNPIFGHGLDRFDANTGMLYPHNIVLQLLYDGGIVLFSCLVIPLVKSISNLFKTCTIGEYAVFTVLFFSSIPGAFFSGNLWNLARVWLFLGFMLSRSFVIEDRKR